MSLVREGFLESLRGGFDNHTQAPDIEQWVPNRKQEKALAIADDNKYMGMCGPQSSNNGLYAAAEMHPVQDGILLSYSYFGAGTPPVSKNGWC